MALSKQLLDLLSEVKEGKHQNASNTDFRLSWCDGSCGVRLIVDINSAFITKESFAKTLYHKLNYEITKSQYWPYRIVLDIPTSKQFDKVRVIALELGFEKYGEWTSAMTRQYKVEGYHVIYDEFPDIGQTKEEPNTKPEFNQETPPDYLDEDDDDYNEDRDDL